MVNEYFMNKHHQISWCLFAMCSVAIKYISIDGQIGLFMKEHTHTHAYNKMHTSHAYNKIVCVCHTHTLFYCMHIDLIYNCCLYLWQCILLGSDLNELHQHVNPVVLPKSLGGFLEEEECDTSQFVLDNLSYLRYERSFI